jgi:hypothetical protein
VPPEHTKVVDVDWRQVPPAPPANAGIAVANIIAAMTSATVTINMMRLIMRYLLSVKAELVSPAVLRNKVSMRGYKG